MTTIPTAEIITDLAHKEKQGRYYPNPEVTAQLSHKALRLLIGPTAIGKSTLMYAAAHQSDVAVAKTIVSRAPRIDDDTERYRYIPHTTKGINEFNQRVLNGELVQYAIHPTTGNIYASDIDCYPDKINLFDVLATGVEAFRKLPCDTTTFKIVCSSDQWKKRLEERFPSDKSKELKKRLAEAAMSLEWGLDDTDSVWIINNFGDTDSAVQQIIQPELAVKYSDHRMMKAMAEDLLFTVRDLSSGV